MMLADLDMLINPQTTAIVITDPQNAYLDPRFPGYQYAKGILKENNTIENIETILQTARRTKYSVYVSPHYYYPYDHDWKFAGAGEKFMHRLGMYDRPSPMKEVIPGSQADFYKAFKPYIEDGKTIITSPHKIYGPETNDLVLQLRKHGIGKVLLAGLSSNLCVDSHMRELSEQGFQVGVIYDATAASGEDAFQAAMVNFKTISSGAITTKEAVQLMNAQP